MNLIKNKKKKINMKYEITEEYKEINDIKVFRIKALKDFGGVKKGDTGGWIEKETNLSQEGNCWVFDNAQVFNDSRVFGNAWIDNNVRISGNSRIFEDAYVGGNANVSDEAWIRGNAVINGNTLIMGEAGISGNTRIRGNVCIAGKARICGEARIMGDAQVCGDYWIKNPLFIVGTKDSITHCAKNKIAIGCEIQSIEYWKNNYKEMGEKYCYSDGEIKEYYEYILLCEKANKRIFGE